MKNYFKRDNGFLITPMRGEATPRSKCVVNIVGEKLLFSVSSTELLYVLTRHNIVYNHEGDILCKSYTHCFLSVVNKTIQRESSNTKINHI
jgi:hypothetical protein